MKLEFVTISKKKDNFHICWLCCMRSITFPHFYNQSIYLCENSNFYIFFGKYFLLYYPLLELPLNPVMIFMQCRWGKFPTICSQPHLSECQLFSNAKILGPCMSKMGTQKFSLQLKDVKHTFDLLMCYFHSISNCKSYWLHCFSRKGTMENV